MEKQLKIFDEYHHGAINILIHDVGFALWGYGVGTASILLIVIAPLIFESGHLYNYLSGTNKKYAKEMIPAQIATFILFVSFGILLTKILHWRFLLSF